MTANARTLDNLISTQEETNCLQFNLVLKLYIYYELELKPLIYTPVL